jgi:hypothetical protein
MKSDGASSPSSSLMRAGAYGLHLPDLQDAADLLIETPEEWPRWHITMNTGCGAPTEFVERSRARVCVEPSGWVDIDLPTRTSTIHLPQEPAHAHIVHPFFASTALVVAHWRGLQSFHAGAFVTRHGAWAILGDKGAGKSSLLAALSCMDVPILTDDVLVIGEQLQGFAGPRCIDLRRETASALGLGINLGVVGTRERWRLQLDPVAAEFPLMGWISLGWGKPTILGVSMQQRISTLYECIALRVEQRDPGMLARLMDLIALPMVQVQRPRSIASLDSTAAAIFDHVENLPTN